MLHKTFNNVSKKLITTAAFDELDRALMWAVAALLALSITLASDVHSNSYPQRSTSGVGVDGTPPKSFWYVEVFWSSKQDEVYFMGGGAAGGLWRHQQWLPSWPPSWIFLRFFEQHLPRNDRPLMRSSDVTTTRKPGSDFDWLIV